MISRLFGRSRKSRKTGEQHQLAALTYRLHQRRTQIYIPFLEAKLASLQARIEQKTPGG